MQTASLVDSCSPALCASQGGCNLRVDSKKGNESGCWFVAGVRPFPLSSSRSGLFQNHARDKKRTHNPVIVSKDNPVEFDTRKGENGTLRSLCIGAKTRQKRWMRTRVKRQNSVLFGKAETREYFAVRDLPSFLCLGVGSMSVVGKTSPCGDGKEGERRGRDIGLVKGDSIARKSQIYPSPSPLPRDPSFRPAGRAGFRQYPQSPAATHSFEPSFWVWKRQRRYKGKNLRKQDIGESSYPSSGSQQGRLSYDLTGKRCWGELFFSR